MVIEDRRRGERIKFPDPLAGTVDGIDVEINQLSLLGCRMTHVEPLPEREWYLLSSEWEGERFELECRQARSEQTEDDDGAPMFITGLEFLRSRGISGQIVHELIAAHVERALSDYRANALGLSWGPAESVPLLKRLGRGPGSRERNSSQPKRRFAAHWTDEDGTWKSAVVDGPAQPASGFTVLMSLEEEDVELLRRVWEAADDDHRYLIRLVAELSLADELETSPLRA
jgi:hypothetical protein